MSARPSDRAGTVFDEAGEYRLRVRAVVGDQHQQALVGQSAADEAVVLARAALLVLAPVLIAGCGINNIPTKEERAKA